ncbi:MAG TPA: hypothetical protein VEY30_00030, partial [Myxococcaceae bacterium]|nr:hypothetical protein [Myxococcaceae bacterium]
MDWMDVPRTQSLAAATLPWVLLFITTACGSERPGEPEGGVDELDPISVPRVVPLNLLFVHGVSLDPDGRMRADESLAALEAYLLEAAQPLMETYEREHPGVDLQLASRRVNLYTGPDGQPLVPTIDQPSDGTGVPAATAWRTQLVQKLEQAYPNGERNILLVGHSTGARVAMEVAAHVGGNGGPGSFDWGVQDRIAGVVTMNGMLDALQKREYNFLATLDFVSGCN